MSNRTKSRRLAAFCFVASIVKLALALVPLGESPFPDDPGVAGRTIFMSTMMICSGFGLLGLTLIPMYREYVVVDPLRIRTRRYLGWASVILAVALIVVDMWPNILQPFLSVATFVIGLCFVYAVYLDYSGDDKPRKRRRRFKAKWPSWLRTRWDPAPPLPKPRPTR